jgi:hypothetical protein
MIHDFFRRDLSIFIGLELTIFWVAHCAQIVFANIKANDLIKHIQKPSSFDIFAKRCAINGTEKDVLLPRK